MTRCATGAALFVLLASALAGAEEIAGKVVFARGQEVRIRVSGDVAPSPGDRFDLFKIQIDPLFQDQELCGHGTVKSIKGDIVTASVDDGGDEAPCRGQTVKIVSEKAAPLDAVSRKHDPLAGDPPTEEEARAWVGAIAGGCARGDYSGLADALDWDAVQRRILAPVTLSDHMTLICSGMLDMLSENFSEMLWHGELARPTTCKLLKFRQVNGETRALVRFMEGAEPRSLRYVDLVLLQSPAKDFRVIDAWQFETGELLSAYLRRMLLPDANSLRKLNQMRSPSAADIAVGKEHEPLWAYSKLTREGDFKAALDFFDRNAATLMPLCLAHLLRILGSAKAAPESCAKFVAEAEEAIPGDPAIEYAAAIALETAKQSDLALAAWDRFEKTIGGDPFLDLARSRLHLAAGRLKEARDCATRAADAEPALIDGWQALLGVALHQRDFKEGVRVLRAMGEKGFKMEDMKGLPAADDFMRSDEYTAWQSGK